MRLLKFYVELLASMQVRADKIGLLTLLRSDGQSDPIKVTVDGVSKRLVLPDPELLRTGIPDELVAFHPLSEMSNRGESEVFKKLKLLIGLRLTSIFAAMFEDLAELAVDKKQHSSASPKLLPLFEALSEADPKMVSNFMAVIEASLTGGKNRLISIYLKRGGTHRGEKHARVAVVSFPVLEELENEDRTVYGVPLRVKDVRMFKDFFEWLLPESNMAGTYNGVSDSMDAPYFQALLRCYVKVAKQLNKIRKIAAKHLDGGTDLHVDLSWEDNIDQLEALRFEIPALDGNKGIGAGGAKEDEVDHSVSRNVMSSMENRVSASEPSKILNPTPGVYMSPTEVARQVEETPFEVEKQEEKSCFNTNLRAADLRLNASGVRTIQAGAPAPVSTVQSRSIFAVDAPPVRNDPYAWNAQPQIQPSNFYMPQQQNTGVFSQITLAANGQYPVQVGHSGWNRL